MGIEALRALEECLAVGEELGFQVIRVGESAGVDGFDGVVLRFPSLLGEVAAGDGARAVILGPWRLGGAGRVAVAFLALGVASR